MGDRAVYCARLESVCAERHPGFESPPIRHRLIIRRLTGFLAILSAGVFFSLSGSSGAAEQKIASEPRIIKDARAEFRVGHFDKALALLDQTGKGSANADAMDLRGLIYLEQGRFEEARKEFRAAAETNPARFASKLHLGDAFLREKKFMEARDVYVDLMRETNVQVSMEKARYGLLLTYLFTQDDARAQTALERIGFPTASPAYYYAQGAWEFAHGHPGDAKEWLKAAGKMFDEESTAWFARPLYSYGWLKGKPALPAS